MPIKLLDRVRIPVLDVELPSIELPDIPPPPLKLDERQLEILRFAIMDDIGEHIPLVGDILSDIAYAEIRRRMTSDEYERFLNDNKWLPSTIAALKVFIEKGLKPSS
jgi:hypothetical protein